MWEVGRELMVPSCMEERSEEMVAVEGLEGRGAWFGGGGGGEVASVAAGVELSWW